jgi:hypothetical protein
VSGTQVCRKRHPLLSCALSSTETYFPSHLLQCCSIYLQHAYAVTPIKPVKNAKFQRSRVFPMCIFGLGNYRS